MCRLYGFRANEPTKVECTLVHAQNALLIQSRTDTRGVSHADGWGIGYYDNGTPHVERRTTAAYRDLHFSATAERVYARTVIAHVRRATVGRASEFNTHPFTCGRWMFAHNGTVRPFPRVRPLLEGQIEKAMLRQRRGTTDSELLFYWLLTRLRHAGIDLDHRDLSAASCLRVFATAITEVAEICDRAQPRRPPQLNVLLTNGDVLLASRWNHTLHYVERQGIHDCEICGIPHISHFDRSQYRAVVIASEPISHEAWQEVPNHSFLAVDKNIRLLRETAVATG